MSSSYRTLWLSDVHLGTSAARAQDLLDFLKSVSADTIFLNGDIIDLAQLKTQGVFPDTHQNVLLEFVRMSRAGTRVIFLPGNHDIEFRQLAGEKIFGIPVMLEARHVTPGGRRLLVLHGDRLDRYIRVGAGLGRFGVAAYRALVQTHIGINRIGQRLGFDYIPLGAYIKKRVVSANHYIRSFEEVAARYAAVRGFDGIVCGHIHRPCIRRIVGVSYANSGDWVEHRSALAELHDGRLQLLEWRKNALAQEPAHESTAIAA